MCKFDWVYDSIKSNVWQFYIAQSQQGTIYHDSDKRT